MIKTDIKIGKRSERRKQNPIKNQNKSERRQEKREEEGETEDEEEVDVGTEVEANPDLVPAGGGEEDADEDGVEFFAVERTRLRLPSD